MNLENKLIIGATLSVIAFTVGCNLSAYNETKRNLKRGVSMTANEKDYEDFKNTSIRGKIVYFLTLPGRFLAYRHY